MSTIFGKSDMESALDLVLVKVDEWVKQLELFHKAHVLTDEDFSDLQDLFTEKMCLGEEAMKQIRFENREDDKRHYKMFRDFTDALGHQWSVPCGNDNIAYDDPKIALRDFEWFCQIHPFEKIEKITLWEDKGGNWELVCVGYSDGTVEVQQ